MKTLREIRRGIAGKLKNRKDAKVVVAEESRTFDMLKNVEKKCQKVLK